jgi:DNA-directed RNA polymerase subunit RPC12/RpoP
MNETYDISEYKVKKAYGNNPNCSIELLIDPATNVSSSTTPIAMEQHTFNISQILRKETGDLKFINLKGKVVDVNDVSTVGNYPDNKSKRSVHIADSTGHIELVLWRERAEDFQYKQDDVLFIQSAILSMFNGNMMITTVYETVIKKIDEEMNVATAKRARPVSNVMSLQTTVLGIKDFSCNYTCVSCSNSLETSTYEECDLIECPRCGAQFLRDHASLVCKCLLLLNNKQWFKANTAVSKTLTTAF